MPNPIIISNLAKTQRKSMLGDAIEWSRAIAIEALREVFEELGVERQDYLDIENVPIGLKKNSAIPGMYVPGIDVIILGERSDDVKGWLKRQDQASLRQLSQTIAHEMLHLVLSGPDETGELVSISDLQAKNNNLDAICGESWLALEETFVETLALIALQMFWRNTTLREEAGNLENFCESKGCSTFPALSVMAHLIGQADFGLLRWYLEAAASMCCYEDRFEQYFGAGYSQFMNNLLLFYRCEIGELIFNEKRLGELVEEEKRLIDNLAQKKGSTEVEPNRIGRLALSLAG